MASIGIRSIFDQTRLVAFDLETSGRWPEKGDRVIEIGAVLIEGARLTDEFHSLVSTDVPISIGAQKVHGISRRQLEGMPSSQTVMQSFARFIGDSMLVAHNAAFDRRFLRCEFDRLGLPLHNKFACTMRLSRRMCPGLGSYNLEAVYRYLFGALEGGVRRHRALDDARLVARIWLELAHRKERR